MCVVVFFFQAEDGIRDLVRSRGLGDVYKRQELAKSKPDGGTGTMTPSAAHRPLIVTYESEGGVSMTITSYKSRTGSSPALRTSQTVSYTHLTLPASDLV